ncbi:MAG: hypothetical protein R3F61_11390 [Myxococcota bacterium]
MRELRLPVRVATTVAADAYTPRSARSRLMQFLVGQPLSWTLLCDPAGFGIEGASRRWAWSELDAVFVRGVRGATTVELRAGAARIELWGKMLPLTCTEGWSLANVRAVAATLAEAGGVVLTDPEPPTEALIAEKVEALRLTARPTQDRYRVLFVGDPKPLIPRCEDTPDALIVRIGHTLRVWVGRREVRVGAEHYALSDIAAADLVLHEELDAVEGRILVFAAIAIVYEGRPITMLTERIDRGGVLQLSWLAHELDRVAQAVPFEDRSTIPDTLQALRGHTR